jgi:hypothetical protein
MEKNASNDLNYFLRTEVRYKNDLGNIRHWTNLKSGIEGDFIWIKDFDYAQVNSLEVKSIPCKIIYYSRGGKLFLQDSQLPDCTIPSLLWTPIDRALPVTLPSFNHNYFGLSEKISVKIISSENEAEAIAMITSAVHLNNYIEKAPAVRFKNIFWTIINGDKVFLYGQPLLPIDGEAYWQRGGAILPAGYDFELYSLTDSLNYLVDSEESSLVVWNKDNTYALINKEDLEPLSLSSFRLSMQQLAIK